MPSGSEMKTRILLTFGALVALASVSVAQTPAKHPTPKKGPAKTSKMKKTMPMKQKGKMHSKTSKTTKPMKKKASAPAPKKGK